MYPVLFHIGNYAIPSYGAAMLLACLVCGLLVLRNFPLSLLALTDIYNFFLIILIAIFFGGQMASTFLTTPLSHASLAAHSSMWQGGGLASYPTLSITLLFLSIYCRIRHIPHLITLDFLFPYALLALAIQRGFGCFLAGCCYGLPTDHVWGMHFSEHSLAGRAFPGLSLHPTQLYYSISALVSALLLMVYERRRIRRSAGELFALGLALLSISYFFISFLRGDLGSDVMVLGWNVWQFVSLLVFASSLLLYLIVLRLAHNRGGITF